MSDSKGAATSHDPKKCKAMVGQKCDDVPGLEWFTPSRKLVLGCSFGGTLSSGECGCEA